MRIILGYSYFTEPTVVGPSLFARGGGATFGTIKQTENSGITVRIHHLAEPYAPGSQVPILGLKV